MTATSAARNLKAVKHAQTYTHYFECPEAALHQGHSVRKNIFMQARTREALLENLALPYQCVSSAMLPRQQDDTCMSIHAAHHSPPIHSARMSDTANPIRVSSSEPVHNDSSAE